MEVKVGQDQFGFVGVEAVFGEKGKIKNEKKDKSNVTHDQGGIQDVEDQFRNHGKGVWGACGSDPKQCLQVGGWEGSIAEVCRVMFGVMG